MYLAHDAQKPERLAALAATLGGDVARNASGRVVVGSGRGDEVFLDLLLMLRARTFIGNCGSSFARNVARVREVALGARASQNIQILHGDDVR